ncbi:MAG: helix-turn-helix domain-containing protein [Chloroflexota bacterium]
MVDKLGPRLREAREAKGATLEDAEAATHIRTHFLESLEAGDFAAFGGGDVQVRGFLCIYARYLDLPPDDIVRRYSAEVHGGHEASAEEAQLETQPQSNDPPDDLTSIRFHPRDIPMDYSLPRWMSVKTVIVVGVVLTLLLGLLALATYLMNQPEGEQLFGQLTTPASAETVQLPTSQTETTATADQVSVMLEATDQVQVRVKRGEEVLFQEMMAPGQVERWREEETIMVEAGNGTALMVTVNGTELGALCDERGRLCTRAWDPSGEVTP